MNTAPIPELAAPERALLSERTVAEVMHAGVVTCLPRASIRDVARIMSTSHIHAVVVWGDEEDDSEGIWGIISTLDLIVAAATGAPSARSAVGVAGTPVVTVEATDTLAHAAELMRKHGTTHLVVSSAAATRPAGILSALDIARAIAERPAD